MSCFTFKSIQSKLVSAKKKARNSFKCLHLPDIQSTINPRFTKERQASITWLKSHQFIAALGEFQRATLSFSSFVRGGNSNIQLKVRTHSWVSRGDKSRGEATLCFIESADGESSIRLQYCAITINARRIISRFRWPHYAVPIFPVSMTFTRYWSRCLDFPIFSKCGKLISSLCTWTITAPERSLRNCSNVKIASAILRST